MSFENFKTRKVFDEPGDSNHIWWNELQQAKKDIEANKAAESSAFNQLPAADQDRYARLVALTEPTPGNKIGNPAARRALQKQLLDGRLTRQASYAGGSGTLLSGLAAIASAGDGDRSLPQRLLAPAIMELGGPLWGLPSYDNGNDSHRIGPVPIGGGMFSGGSAYVNTQLEGVKYDSNTFFHWNRDGEWQEIKDALAAGRTLIPVGVMWSEDGVQGGHELHIEKIEGGKVYYSNPWGMRETMDEAEFKAHITSSEIPRAG